MADREKKRVSGLATAKLVEAGLPTGFEAGKVFLFGLFILCFCLPLISTQAMADEPVVVSQKRDSASSGLDRCRVFLLRYVSAKDAKQLLADVNITNVSQLSDANTLLVTASQEQLLKASAMLTLVDSPEKYVVKALLPVSEANEMPKISAIQQEIGNISIGTFFNLPGGAGLRAIIDVQDDKLVAIAPAAVMDKIVALVGHAQQSAIFAQETEQSNKAVSAERSDEPNELFSELLGAISEAEKGLPPRGTGKGVTPSAAEPNTTQRKPAEAEATSLLAIAGAERGELTRRYEPKAVPEANETLELALPEKLEVIQLLDLVGKYLNLNYVYDPKQLQGKEVYLKVQGPIKVKELYPLAESVLKFTGLVMSRKENLVTIVPVEGALDIDPALIDSEGGRIEYGDVVVTRIFQLNYVDTARAKGILDGMKVGAVTEIPTTGTLIVTGYAFRMSRVEQLLDVIDKPGKPKQFKFRQLKYTMAKTLAPKIKGLVEQMGDISIAVASPQATAAQPPVRRGPVRQPMPQPAQPGGAAKPSVYLDADERTNRILMIGQDIEINVVEQLIDALDVEQQDLRMLKMYEIQHVDAEEVRRKLEELGVIGTSRSATPGRITARAAAPGAPGQPAAPPSPTTAEAELPTEEMQVVVIESTNSLLVNASPEQHALIANIIAYVDSESIQQMIPYVVYPLQNQPPGHVAEVLEKLVQEVVRDKEGKVEKVVKRTEENIIIVPDPNTFSLIVYASKKNQDWISSLIKSLDRRRPQVLIDVTLVEVTRGDTFDLDLELATKFPKMVSGNLGFLPVIDSNSLGQRSRAEAFSFPKGGASIPSQGFYSDQHIQALLTALETKNYGRILAKPKILVNDGQVGVIKTTDTTNVQLIGQTLVGGTGDQSIVTSTSYQPYEAGITLTIQPNISEGDLLLLIVKLDRTDFLKRTDKTIPPDTTSSNVDTIVTVPNNKTIILGGLLKLNQGKGGNKVPLLGDIPLVGGLFRSTSNSVDDSKLYVFVKANILRPEETLAGLPELERISERNRAAFEKAEDEFQKYQDWPGIKPTPVDPPKVLDAE